MAPGLTYVVTGGCGFLGSHIVNLLVHKGENISEIRVVDTNLGTYRPPEKTGIKVSLLRGDVTDMAQMTQACAGADVVIHTASIIDVNAKFSDEKLWDVNVKGTENLLQCCVNEDVSCLVYTSSVEAVGPNRRGDPMEDGDESTPYVSSSPMIPYSRTKAAAEAMVLQWNGRRTNGGKTLRTCALRPGGFYGDGAMTLLKTLSRKYKNNLFIKPVMRICDRSVKVSRQYVGNVAWAHILAADKLITSPQTVGGEVFYITDDTPLQDELTLYDELCAPIGIRFEENLVAPLWLLYFIAYVLAVIRFVLKPWYNFVPPLNVTVLRLLNTTFYFNSKKAARLLGYKPLYSWEKSKRRTAEWLVQWKAEGATFS